MLKEIKKLREQIKTNNKSIMFFMKDEWGKYKKDKKDVLNDNTTYVVLDYEKN